LKASYVVHFGEAAAEDHGVDCGSMKSFFARGKGKATKFDYYINIHTLKPWPTQYTALAVAYARGTHKGMTKAARPAVVQPGQLWTHYDFEEAFHIPCTLYQVKSGRFRQSNIVFDR
jgi:N-terminal C2 in EEIG1 and EHBP1 proteins